MATVVHLLPELRTGVPFEIGNFPFRAADLKFTKLRQIRSLPVTSFDTCPNKLLLLRFWTSCVYRVSFAEHEQFIEGDIRPSLFYLPVLVTIRVAAF